MRKNFLAFIVSVIVFSFSSFAKADDGTKCISSAKAREGIANRQFDLHATLTPNYSPRPTTFPATQGEGPRIEALRCFDGPFRKCAPVSVTDGHGGEFIIQESCGQAAAGAGEVLSGVGGTGTGGTQGEDGGDDGDDEH